MDIVKLSKLNFLKKEIKGFGKQSKSLDHGNKRVAHKVEILKKSNDVCESIIALYFISIGNQKINQVISVILSKLAKKDIEGSQSGGDKARLIKTRWPQLLKIVQ